MTENADSRPVPSPETLAGTLFMVVPAAEERPHCGQFLGIGGWVPDEDNSFHVVTELAEHGFMPRATLEEGIESGAFVEIENRDELADFIEFDMDVEGESIEITESG